VLEDMTGMKLHIVLTVFAVKLVKSARFSSGQREPNPEKDSIPRLQDMNGKP